MFESHNSREIASSSQNDLLDYFDQCLKLCFRILKMSKTWLLPSYNLSLVKEIRYFRKVFGRCKKINDADDGYFKNIEE